MIAVLVGVFCTPLTGCYKSVEKTVTQEVAVPVRTAKIECRDVQLYSYYRGRTDVNPIKIVPRI
ncbi:MAG: hypothetical protein IKW74_07060, partial [Thermoguttaceae bacterium]|nr:hypothetical protein [Thermoguttaceae bacterium]